MARAEWFERLRRSRVGALRRRGREVLERHDQLPGLAAKTLEAVLAIELNRRVVLGAGRSNAFFVVLGPRWGGQHHRSRV
jgi:glycosyltransferase A (GT-A) superfamily protein (DUF2064 family)